MAAFRQLSTHGQKIDPESLYECEYTFCVSTGHDHSWHKIEGQGHR